MAPMRRSCGTGGRDAIGGRLRGGEGWDGISAAGGGRGCWPTLCGVTIRGLPEYSAVMVNISDVAAMGGKALGIVDVLWALQGRGAGRRSGEAE